MLATNALGELIFKAATQWKETAIVIDDTNKKFFEFFNIKNAVGTYDAGSAEHRQMLTVLLHAADSFLAAHAVPHCDRVPPR